PARRPRVVGREDLRGGGSRRRRGRRAGQEDPGGTPLGPELPGAGVPPGVHRRRTHEMTELVRSVLWRRLDQPGAETCELRGGKDGSHLYGVTVLALEGRPTVVRYHVACDLA